MELTAKQKAFVLEYLVDLNASQAAIRAGYAKKGINAASSALMRHPRISAAIKEAMAARNERTAITADYVLQRLVEIDQLDVIDIMNDDMSLKPLREWPKAWRQYLVGFDLAEMFEGQAKERDMVGMLKKIKWPDKVKNLELLGKHINVNAFREQVGVSGADGGPIKMITEIKIVGVKADGSPVT